MLDEKARRDLAPLLAGVLGVKYRDRLIPDFCVYYASILFFVCAKRNFNLYIGLNTNVR